ncbi:MAG: trimeric intracellular cation channel family protein [Clostridia bacterium]|nr:trimeric intracellular cation channel family protein [Clostridia bacterium]
MNQILTTLEIIGILAAALSGAMLAIDKKMDLFGVVIIGMVTGLGGGVMRDVTLGYIPRSFSNPSYLIAAVVPPLVMFLVALLLQQRYVREEALIDRINNIFDALGLGAFAVGGAVVARAVGYDGHFVVVVFSGVITAVGGGVLRDVLLREIPSILKKHVYAIAALAGTVVYYLFLHFGAGEVLSAVAGVLLVFILRILATIFRWNFPKAIK